MTFYENDTPLIMMKGWLNINYGQYFDAVAWAAGRASGL